MPSHRCQLFAHADQLLIEVAKSLIELNYSIVVGSNLQINLGNPTACHQLFEPLHEKAAHAFPPAIASDSQVIDPAAATIEGAHDGSDDAAGIARNQKKRAIVLDHGVDLGVQVEPRTVDPAFPPEREHILAVANSKQPGYYRPHARSVGSESFRQRAASSDSLAAFAVRSLPASAGVAHDVKLSRASAGR